MTKINTFYYLGIAFCIGFCSNALAAPSIKRLGTGNSLTGTTNAVNAKYGTFIRNTDANNNSGRVSAVRSVGSGQLKTATVSKPTVVTNNTNNARLSVGKYLHGAGTKAGIIKPINSTTPDTAGLNDISARIDYLENQVNNKLDNDALNNYYTKSEVDAKIAETKSETVSEITADIQDAVDTAVNETVAPAVEQKVSELLGAEIARKPDWKPDIFGN